MFVRAVVDEQVDAREWVRRAALSELTVSVPSLVYYEIGNALLRYVRGGSLSLRGAVQRLELTRSVPVRVREEHGIVAAAIGVASQRGLSTYDAVYVVLAEAEGATLVTADRGLANATARSELLP